MSSSPIRVRFAPSPTGYLHIGGARTALYNYLLARKHHGVFVLRIEDTDRERSTDESIQAILDGMNWLGLKWDEGPFYQTKRYDRYQEAIEILRERNLAYPCFCTAEELEKKRKLAQEQKVKYRYDRTCYNLTKAERDLKLSSAIPHCIRFYSSDEGTITIRDAIKGEVNINAIELDDLIIRRTDGNPTYNLTVVVDDIDMKITHVIRGDDHLNNTPRQIQMYEALGADLPVFAHLPMILGNDKQRLSKRHGATSVMAYRDMGYLPHAVLNYLVKLGWSYKDQEIFSMDEMIESFSLEGCNASAAVFNPEKLDWMNGHYIRLAQPVDLLEQVTHIMKIMGIESPDETLLLEAIRISREKVKTLREMAEFIEIFFRDVAVDDETVSKTLDDEGKKIVSEFAKELEKTQDVSHDSIHALFEKLMARHNIKLGKIANPVRVAVSGKKISPSVFDLIRIFGKEKSLQLIHRFVS